jgi:hypothetical protein
MKKMGLGKIRKQFFSYNFLGGLLSLRQVCFFEISINSQFFDTLYDQFQEKKISPLRRADFKI